MNTTLHGLKYIGDRRLTRMERLFFTSMFVLVLLMSGYYISDVWNKWNVTPMIITQSAVSTSVRDIPFPAVTICNLNQVQKSAIANIQPKSAEYSIVRSICRHTVDDNVTDSITGNWSMYQQVLFNVAQSCEKMLVSCYFGGVEYECSKLFTRILTDGGLCCNFNALSPKFMLKSELNPLDAKIFNNFMEKMANDWSPNTVLKTEELNWNTERIPRLGIGSGDRLGLTVILNVELNEYLCSSRNGYGFKVLLHAPHQLPLIDEYGIGIANGFESRIIATPMISGASKAIRRIPMHVRQCVYQNENFLSFYRVYSRDNCKNECTTKIYLSHCNCVLYYMFRPDHTIPICDQTSTKCVEKVEREILSKRNNSFKCDCYHSCNAINFDMKSSATPIFQNSPYLKTNNLSTINISILDVFFQFSFYSSQIKGEFIGFTGFLSNIGGLLSLFMGFSVFSIVELFYFFLIRLYCDHTKSAQRRRQEKQRTFLRYNHIKFKVDDRLK